MLSLEKVSGLSYTFFCHRLLDIFLTCARIDIARRTPPTCSSGQELDKPAQHAPVRYLPVQPNCTQCLRNLQTHMPRVAFDLESDAT
jgi:hypothetical protein